MTDEVIKTNIWLDKKKYLHVLIITLTNRQNYTRCPLNYLAVISWSF